MEDGWGPRGKPTISDAVHEVACASNLGEATAFLNHLTNELDGGAGYALRAEFLAADGFKQVVRAMDDFGFPDEDGSAIDDDGITSDVCATLGCIIIYLTTNCASAAEEAHAGPLKQAAVDAGALPMLEELMQAWAESEDVVDAALHAVDSLTEGGSGSSAAHGRKLAALEAGLLPAVLRGLRRHTSSKVQEFGLGALARLVGIDEAHRSTLLPDDAESVTALQPMASSHPRQVAFESGAVELARAAIGSHAATSRGRDAHDDAQGLQVVRQAATVLANLAMGPDENAPARKAAVRRVMPEVLRAMERWPGGQLVGLVAALQRNLCATTFVDSMTSFDAASSTEEAGSA